MCLRRCRVIIVRRNYCLLTWLCCNLSSVLCPDFRRVGPSQHFCRTSPADWWRQHPITAVNWLWHWTVRRYEIANLYDRVITSIVNTMIRVRAVRYVRLPLDPWFDDECRAMKRTVRHLERTARRADPCDVVATTAAHHGKDGRSVVCVVSSAASIRDEPLKVARTLFSLSGLFEIWVSILIHTFSMNTHITRTVSCCFAVLQQIRSISRYLSQPVVQSLIVSLVISRLDYGSATRAGLPACQSVLRCGASDLQIQEIRPRDPATARPSLVVNLGTNHVSAGGFGVPLLSEWTGTTVHSTLLMTFTRWRRSSHGDSSVRRRLRHWSSQPRRVLQSALGHGTAFRPRWRHQRPFRFSESILRQFCLLAPSCSTVLRFILSYYFILQFYVFFYYVY